jgi:HSP20 family molecular chaperone IbpA
MVNNLAKKHGNKVSQEKKQRVPTQNVCDWDDEVSRWIDNTHKLWMDDMDRMRNGMLVLVPCDEYDLDPVNMYGPLGIFGPGGDIPSLLNKMDRQMEALDQMFANQPATGAVESSLVPHHEVSPLDFLKDVYELDEDGKVHFKVRFNAQGYRPEDIKVTTSKNRLNVHAKKSSNTKNVQSSSEFCRTIYLPPSVDIDKFQCHLTNDGVLMVEAPVKEPNYQALTFDKERQLGVRPSSAPPVSHDANQKAIVLKPTGHFGAAVLQDGNQKKFHVEVPVEAGFDPKNMCVRMESNQIVVSGKQEITEGSGANKCVSVKEFTRAYSVPETVDPLSIHAQMFNGVLVVEAPMIHPKSK